MKKMKKRVIAFAMMLLVMFTTVFTDFNMMTVNAAEEVTTIAEWAYATANDAPAVAGFESAPATSGNGTLTVSGATYTGYSSKAFTANNWSEKGYFQMEVDAAGYKSLELSAKMRVTKTAPGYFCLKVSTDNGETWTSVGEEKAITDKLAPVFTNEKFNISGEKVLIRLAVSKYASSLNGSLGSTGNVNINDIVIKGSVSEVGSGTDKEPEKKEECAGVTADVQTGDVPYGTVVTLSCATEGATIMYSTDKKNYQKYTKPFVITSDVEYATYATKAGMEDSHSCNYGYKVKPLEKVTSLKDGQKLVIYNADKSAVLTSEVSGKILSGSGAKVSGGVLDVYNKALTLKVATVVKGDTTYYRFVDDSDLTNITYLTSGKTGNELTLSSLTEGDVDYSLWELAPVLDSDKNETGDFYIISKDASFTKNNTVNRQALEYYSGFTTYNYTATPSAAYVMSFYDAELTRQACGDVVATPAAGKVKSGTEVTLSSATKDAKIYFSYDGKNFIEYTKPIVIDTQTSFTAYASKEGFGESAKTSFDYTIAVEEETEDATATEATLVTGDLLNGDQLVIYHVDSKTSISDTASGKKLVALDTTVSDGKLALSEEVKTFVVEMVDEESFHLVCDGKYLTSGATGSALSLEEKASEYSVWTIAKATTEDCVYLINKNAKYGTSNQYIEYYNGFTTYSYKAATENAYALQLYRAKAGKKSYACDTTITQVVAQWAGNRNYEEAGVTTVVNGDLFESNDLLDKDAVFTSVKNGVNTTAYQKTDGSGAGNYNYYMVGTGLGSGNKDYMQLAFPTIGYGKLAMSFRLRSTNAAAGSYQMQYSVDGKTFKNLSNGTYSYKYTKYQNNEPTEVAGDGTITNGIVKTSLAAQNYVAFTMELPDEAANAKMLYIRFVPGKDRADKTSGAISATSTTRVDSVVVTGSPVVDKEVTGFVKASEQSGEIALGSILTLTSSTADAKIYYSVDNDEFALYDAELGITIDQLPMNIRTYAESSLGRSAVATYQYVQSKCAAVKGSPNGGAVSAGSRVTLRTATEGAKIQYAFVENADAEVADDAWVSYEGPVTFVELPAVMKVRAVKAGYIDSAISTLSFTQKLNDKYNIYFGQVHAHTNFSDGAGSVEEAFSYARKVANLDYLAVTDHSNSLDNADASKITENVDKSENDEWTKGHTLAKQYSDDKFTCIYGYEMTWSNGLGHMNTFNTAGFQSRTQKEYSTYSTALQNYYQALEKVPDSMSMFNHPGTTFGDFQDFAYYTAERDALITMIEVGNGEGTIGSSGYFPSYEYYTRALDKGWHVSPTNNQDNHKGKWGDANTARSVVLSDTNDEAGIYDAMRNNRMYATEDNNLSIYYTLDSYVMGTVLEKEQVGDTVELKVELKDADKENLGKVEVIVNGGLSIASEIVNTNEKVVTFNVPSSYSYYYIKVTEKDGDIAVTSPVWVGEVEACGINKTYTNSVIAVSGEGLDVNVDLYNNEKEELIVTGVEVVLSDVDGNETPVLSLSGEEAAKYTVAPNGTSTINLDYVYNSCGKVTYNVTVKAELNGVAKVYTDKLSANYVTSKMVTNVIVDGTHFNDYVAGYYGGNVANLAKIAGEKNIKLTVETEKITREMLDSCALLIISAPAKKSGTANAGEYTPSHFEDDFLALVKDYVRNGGSVVVCGMADYQDSTSGQTATEQNKLLEAIGATIRVNSDEVYDEVNNGGQAYRLYPTNFNMDSKYLAGIVEGQKYSQYSGCSINIDNAIENDVVYAAEALVSGFDTTYSIDCKKDDGTASDSKPYVEKGHVTFVAHQATKFGGNIFAAGGVFVSDFEVKAEIDNPSDLPYANKTIIENILDEVTVELPVSTIAEARKGAMNEIFAVEGYVTSGTDNENTTFFDTIYIQDETGGIDIFPYAEAGLKIGTKMRIVGFVAEYQGDRELKVISATILDAPAYVYEAKKVSTKEAMDYENRGGSLLQTSGKVTRVEYNEDGTVAEFWINDGTGEAAIFIDGYILSGTTGKNELASFVEVGAMVKATGILYMHPEGDSDESVPVFRVRNCDEIVLEKAEESVPAKPTTPAKPSVIKPIKDAVDKVVNTIIEPVKDAIENNIVNPVREIIHRIFPNIFDKKEPVKEETAPVEETKDTTKEDTTKDDTAKDVTEEETPLASNEENGSSFPVIPVAGGAAAVVVLGGAAYFLYAGKRKKTS